MRILGYNLHINRFFCMTVNDISNSLIIIDYQRTKKCDFFPHVLFLFVQIKYRMIFLIFDKDIIFLMTTIDKKKRV